MENKNNIKEQKIICKCPNCKSKNIKDYSKYIDNNIYGPGNIKMKINYGNNL